MEVFGGFMMMMSIVVFFLAVIWFILPFVIFAMKGKVDRTLELLEGMDQRLSALELRLKEKQSAQAKVADNPETPNPPPL